MQAESECVLDIHDLAKWGVAGLTVEMWRYGGILCSISERLGTWQCMRSGPV